jgi:DNA-binding transcriptional LysR family regulator
VIAPETFAASEFHRVALRGEPWTVLVGIGHRLAGQGPLLATDLHAEQVVVTGHRDGAAYDRAVAQTLSALGVSPALRSGGSGPALLAGVADGNELAIATAACATDPRIMARPLEPAQTISFELVWRTTTPSLALAELTAIAAELPSQAAPSVTPDLRAVA